MKTNSRYYSPEKQASAVAAYAAGESSELVAEQLGVSASSVLAWAKRAGIPAHGRRRGPLQEPIAYEGGWISRGGVMRPLRPKRRRAA